MYSTDNVSVRSWEPSWFRRFLRETLAPLEGSGRERVQVHDNTDRNTQTLVTRSEEEVDISLEVSLSGVTDGQEEEGTHTEEEQSKEGQTEEGSQKQILEEQGKHGDGM